MPKAPLLDSEEVTARLAALDGWTRSGDAIVKEFSFADFAQAVAFVDALVPIADAMNHHPDVWIHWNRLELRLWTHASGGITDRDFALAAAIEATLAA